MSKPIYTIRAMRTGAWWALEVPELSGVVSQSRRLDQARAMIEDVIELVHDMSPDTYTLELVIEDRHILELADRARIANEAADAAVAAAREQTRAAIAGMREAGLAQRDVGELIGLSHQRVAQIERGT